MTFPTGNIAPEGSVIKSTAIDPEVVGKDGIYRHTGRTKVFTSEKLAVNAIKNGQIVKGDIMVLIGRGPSGTGMEETYQLTSALKHLPFGKYVTLLTDARFSGVSTGACIGHVGPEEGAIILAARTSHPELMPDPKLPDDTRLWAALQAASGGTWRGSIYDVDRIIEVLNAGHTYLEKLEREKRDSACS
jgi:hypothetical protein